MIILILILLAIAFIIKLAFMIDESEKRMAVLNARAEYLGQELARLEEAASLEEAIWMKVFHIERTEPWSA